MPVSSIPDFVIPAALLLWAFVKAHVDMVKQGRLRGYSIVTHFLAMTCLAGQVFVFFYVPEHWKHGAKWGVDAGCWLMCIALMAVTRKWPAQVEAKSRRLVKRHHKHYLPLDS